MDSGVWRSAGYEADGEASLGLAPPSLGLAASLGLMRSEGLARPSLGLVTPPPPGELLVGPQAAVSAASAATRMSRTFRI
jgi:hypothetical protein